MTPSALPGCPSFAAQNPALGDQVAELLAHHAAAQIEQFLDGNAVDPLGLAELAGRSFGGYTLDRPLGQGGMGSVWLARRSDGRYEGHAAVKLLNLGSLGRNGAERLRHEANALAKLSHPNITHLIDAGVAGRAALSRPGVRRRRADRPLVRRAAPRASRLACGCSCRCSRPFRTRTAGSSCIAISSRRTSW